MDESSEKRITRMIFAGSFLISFAILVFFALKSPLKSRIAASCFCGIILVAGTFLIGRLRGRGRKFLQFFLLVSVLNLLIVPPEAYLRMRGFRYESGIQFGYPRPYQFVAFEPDERLFWRFSPSKPGINSYGFKGAEVKIPKPAETFRILYVGNSCTYQGFPAVVESILRESKPAVECLNFATPGYTSYQGKLVVKDYIDELDPDLVVASFGWNDRWLAYGSVDEEKTVKLPGGRAARLLGYLYSRWRLLQLLRKVFSPVMGRIEPLDIPRVPVEHFRKNLREIGSESFERGIPAIFVTEPSSHPRLGVPDFITESKYAVSKESSIALYREYNDIIREVSGEHDTWYLIDLDSLISHREDLQAIFMGDGFHFTAEGLKLVAEIEARFIKDHILTEGNDSR